MDLFITGPLWLPFMEPSFLLHGLEVDEDQHPSFQLEDRSEYEKLLHVWDAAGLLHLEESQLLENHFSRVFNCFKALTGIGKLVIGALQPAVRDT